MEELDDKGKSLAERLEAVGGSGRSIGEGLAGGVGQGMDSLGSLGGALGSAESAVSSLGSAGTAAGGQLKGAFSDAGSAADALGDAGEQTGRRVKSAFQNAADASDDMGASFAKNFTQAQKAGEGFGSSVKTGVVGAFDTAQKKVTGFVKETTTGAKKVGDAFLHPIKTIKDKFSRSMKDAGGDVSDVGDQAKKTERDLDGMGESGEGAGNKLKSGLSKALAVLGAVAIAAAAVTGITKFVSAALDASQAAQNISYSFNQAFGDDAPDVEGWAENFAGAIHRSNSEVKSFLTSNRQLYESMGITGEAANDLSKMTTSLAYDLGNFAGIDDAEALSKLQDAIGGNASALSDFGVRLDDATLKQTALGMGLSGNLDTMDEATLAQVRFNSILEQTGDLQGSASQSLGGLTGGVKAIKAAWTDFLEKAGAKLAPTFDKLFGTILDAWPKIEPALMSFVDLLASGFEQAAPILAEFAEQLLPTVLDLAGEFLPILMDIGGQLLPVLSQVLGTVAQAVQPLLPLISMLAKTLLPPLAQVFGMLVEKLLPPAAQLLGALSPVIDALSPVLQIAASAIGLVADGIAGLIGWLTKGVEKIGEFGQKIADSPIGKVVGGIGSGIGSLVDGAKGMFGGNAKGTDDFEGGWSRVNEAGDEMIQAKHAGGLAFLPRGSAVIPASKTDEILSSEESSGGKVINITTRLQQTANDPKEDSGLLEKIVSKAKDLVSQPLADSSLLEKIASKAKDLAPHSLVEEGGLLEKVAGKVKDLLPESFAENRLEKVAGKAKDLVDRPLGWIPTVIEGNPLLNKATTPQEEPDPKPKPETPDPNGGDTGGGNPDPAGPAPAPMPAAAAQPMVTRREIELTITVRSPDGSVPPEVLEQFREVAREVFQEEQDAEINNLAIQNGYAG